MTTCSEAGPLGVAVHHPGPVVSYYSPTVGIIPVWLFDNLSRNVDSMTGMDQALARQVLRDAEPQRMSMDDDPFVIDLMREAASPVGDSVRFGAGRIKRTHADGLPRVIM